MYIMAGEPTPDPDPHNNEQRSFLLVVPLFHVTGCCATLNPSMAVGGKMVLMRKWEPEQAMQLIEREKVTQTGGVPTIAWQLIEHPASRQVRPVEPGQRRLSAARPRRRSWFARSARPSRAQSRATAGA